LLWKHVELLHTRSERNCGSQTSTKTIPMMGASRIMNGSNPQTTAPQFMPQPIHALPITNDNRHHVCRRSPSIQSETTKLRVEVIGVFPKLGPQFRLLRAELQRF